MRGRSAVNNKIFYVEKGFGGEILNSLDIYSKVLLTNKIINILKFLNFL